MDPKNKRETFECIQCWEHDLHVQGDHLGGWGGKFVWQWGGESTRPIDITSTWVAIPWLYSANRKWRAQPGLCFLWLTMHLFCIWFTKAHACIHTSVWKLNNSNIATFGWWKYDVICWVIINFDWVCIIEPKRKSSAKFTCIAIQNPSTPAAYSSLVQNILHSVFLVLFVIESKGKLKKSCCKNAWQQLLNHQGI